MLASGRGGLAKDEAQAVRLYRLAADQGNAIAQVNLGVYYEKGLGGLAKNEREAVRPLDLVHAKLRSRDGRDSVAVGDPERDVVQTQRADWHRRLIPLQPRAKTLRYAIGSFWTLCSVAYASVSELIVAASG